MTLPPCISSSLHAMNKRDISVSTSNLYLINALRQRQQQSRLYSTYTMLRQSEPISRMQTSEPRTASPEVLPGVANESSESEEDTSFPNKTEEREMEDNAAHMLLQLSKIVSKEISSDSGCIARESTDNVIHKSEDSQMDVDMHQTSKRFHASDRNVSSVGITSPFVSIPKSIEIHKRVWEDSLVASREQKPVENKGIPPVVIASNSNSFTNLSSQITSNILSQSNCFDSIAPRSEMNRFRTVSLAGDEIAPEDRELSPLLVPLSSPLSSKDVSYSYSLNDTPPRIQSNHPQFRQHPLALEKREIEDEAIRRALNGCGPGAETALSMALAASDVSAVAALITPVPEQPRPVVTVPIINNKSKIGLETSNTFAGIGSMIRRGPSEDRKGPYPLEIPPLLMNPKKKTEVKIASASRFSQPSKRVASLAGKPAALTRKATTNKSQPTHSPRSKKKPIIKKPQRQKHTGKKFSWKAYPELEEFLIENREEYLSYSAKNYTIEQRDYNNRLTSRLLEHAKNSGYPTLFENCPFSAVRDRIRSYYKSYVQSFKRRKERQQQQERLKKLELSFQQHECTKKQQESVNNIGMSYM